VASVEQATQRDAAVESLRSAFRDFARALVRMRGRDTHVAPGEMTTSKYELLAALAENGACSAAQLACAAELSAPTVAHQLDALAAEGHVERERSTGDRRVVVTKLTSKGSAAIDRKRKHWEGRWGCALEGLDETQIEAAATVLERLSAMLSQEAGEAGSTADRAV
jgi:DNA-binding MarR family transcriptional regulator